ncbi:hypothetical protein CPB84DRAFT_1785230 [Gymnopilus junonius]|uniref:F-box domain-containing protein n=1 Tax=Gymnopilus junonius TaxID=109634 RepID=A0A9P5NL35_GYMJU|nr:hypothetical protein CPB84DRAFT_1785230 [Gymnopilus junonius]
MAQYPPSMASEIPLDVLEVIFRGLTPYDLAICCRVNKQVHALAFEALYRDLRPNHRNSRSFILLESVDMYLGSIAEALLKLSRLHTLILRIGHMSSWILPKEKLSFSLHTFSSEFYFDNALISFLQSQKELKHLSASVSPSPGVPMVIQPHLFPGLVSLVSSMSVVEMIAPGRPLRYVTAYHTYGETPSISCLAQSTSPLGVRQLAINFTYLQTIGCEQVAQAAPKLVTLTIDADAVKPDDYEMVNELTDWIEEYLSYAKDLSCLVIVFHPMVTSIFNASVRLSMSSFYFIVLEQSMFVNGCPGQDWYIVND